MLGYRPQWRTIIIVTNAPVGEQISCWNMVKKWYEEVECVAVKISKLSILCYDSSVCGAVVGGIFCHRSLLTILRKKIGEPKEEIGNLNGFEYMYLSDLKVPYFQCLSSKFHGHNRDVFWFQLVDHWATFSSLLSVCVLQSRSSPVLLPVVIIIVGYLGYNLCSHNGCTN